MTLQSSVDIVGELQMQTLAPQEIYLNTPGKTPFVAKLGLKGSSLPESFYEKGYCIIDEGVVDEIEARDVIENLIASIDVEKAPVYKKFLDKIRLAKRDQIPVCDDSVETSFQALHFDMGQPMFSEEEQNMFMITGLFIPKGEIPKTAKTRVINIKGLFNDSEKFGTKDQVEEKIVDYVKKYGDGWTYPDKVNTCRISCFARVVDAVAGTQELADYFDKTMAQWFRDPENPTGEASKAMEKKFYEERGIDLDSIEEDIVIKPGQILIVDNMRTAHGRIGKRSEKETWQFMYGVHNATPSEIETFRKELVNILTA